MSFSQECTDLFGTKNLYELLKLSAENGKTTKDSEIKKAYYRCSLIYHPDRADGKSKNLATKKFQCISKAYSILSDKERRALYDETGEIDEETFVDSDKDWVAYWRLLFKKITISDIKKFEANYKNSEEERNDLKNAYLKHKGDMNKIMENIFCSVQEDEERFVGILREMIDAEEIPDFSTFSKETKRSKLTRKRKAEKESKEAEEMLKKITGKSKVDSDDLQKMIIERNADREKRMNSFLDNLAAKYQKTETKKRSRRQ